MSTTVTASADGDSDSVEITDSYVLICDGMAYHSGVTVHILKDGTATHVITVKGIKP